MEISIEYSYREKFLAIQVAPHKSLLKFLYLQNDQAGFGDLWDNFFLMESYMKILVPLKI